MDQKLSVFHLFSELFPEYANDKDRDGSSGKNGLMRLQVICAPRPCAGHHSPAESKRSSTFRAGCPTSLLTAPPARLSSPDRSCFCPSTASDRQPRAFPPCTS